MSGDTATASNVVLCSHCNELPATCIGRYDVMTEDAPACSECCGHGNEDGNCRPFQETP